MNLHCTATVVHTNLEIYGTAVVELLCIHSNNHVATFLAAYVKIKLYLADKLLIIEI